MSLKWWIVLVGIAAAGVAIVVVYGWIGLVIFALCDVVTLLIAGSSRRSKDWTGVIQPNCRRRDLMRQLEQGSVSIVDGEVRPADKEHKADS